MKDLEQVIAEKNAMIHLLNEKIHILKSKRQRDRDLRDSALKQESELRRQISAGKDNYNDVWALFCEEVEKNQALKAELEELNERYNAMGEEYFKNFLAWEFGQHWEER